MARPRSQSAQEVAGIRADAYTAAERKALARWLADRERAITGYSQAAAEILKSIGPQVQQGYADAAQRQANFAKGFSIGFQNAAGGNADQANALLAQNGSPQTVTSQGEGGANVIYGMGGVIPASSFEREGAAFGAAASMLPATQLGYGQQALTQLHREGADKRAEIDARRRQLYEQELGNIFDRNMARQKFAEEKRQADINAQIQWQSVKGTLAAYGLDEKRLLQAEAEFMTQQTGFIHKVGNGRVVATQQPAPGSAAARNVADVTADAGASAKDRAAARKEALSNRSDALTTAAGAIRTASADWAGKPIENPKPASLLNPGKYLDKNGKGTNDPDKAASEGGLTWSQMVNRAMATEEVQQLITRYGYSRAKARAKVVAWLRAQGFSPPSSPKKTVRRRRDLGKPNRG